MSDVSHVMALLVLIVGSMVAKFSWNYLEGDSQKTKFYFHLVLLQIVMLSLVYANHIAVLLIAWLLGNAVLIRMMIHQSSWESAYSAGRFAAGYLFGGWTLLLTGFGLLYWGKGLIYISSVNALDVISWSDHVGLLCIIGGAMVQAAIMPVHRWLLNSLNAPTPVSACMHAGVIGAGPLVLIKLSPLYLQSSFLLHSIFLIGCLTAIVAIAYKLIQPNVKRMLVCSTVAQMGFVFVQCGLGFFTAAIAHIFWHGLFKSYLFLTSATLENDHGTHLIEIQGFTTVIALLCGFLSTAGFAYIQGFSDVFSTTLGLLLVVFIAGVQLSFTILQSAIFADIFIACFASISLGIIYGVVDIMIHRSLHSFHGMEAQPLGIVYGIGLLGLLIPWFIMLHMNYLQKFSWFRKMYAYCYVYLLRTTQSVVQAVTAHKSKYRYR